jgi:Bacteriophage probable baseplate hub protein
MAPTPIPIFSQKETFYVPRFEVYVEGEKLKSNIVDDILQVTYKDSINDIDSFSIEINNWDADSRTFKFAPPQKGYETTFDPGKKIEIKMGYYKNLRRMMRGVITGLEPNFPESGASTLSVHGLNELHQLKTEQHTYSWENTGKTDTDIAKELCGRPMKKGQPGLGLTIDAQPDPDESADQLVFMNNEYDIVFMLERARRHGYEIYLEDENATTLFFGRSTNTAQAPTYQLEWGKSLISFRPTLTTSDQVGSVVVRGWDRKANKAIDVTYTLQDLWKAQKKSQKEIARLTKISQAYGNRTRVITNKPAHTTDEAKRLAKAALTETNNKLITATASTVGLPDLRSGCSVEILGFGVQTSKSGALQGAGSIFDGEYFVTDSTHTIGGSGYRTEFTARRDGPVSGTQPGAES